MSVLDRILFLSEELADDYADFEYDNFQKTKKPTRKACDRFTERHGALENLGKNIKALKARISVIQTQVNKKKNSGEDLSRLHKELEDVNRKLTHLENKKNRMLMPKMTIQECLKNYDNFLNEGFGEKIKNGIRNVGWVVGECLRPITNKLRKLFMVAGLAAFIANPQAVSADTYKAGMPPAARNFLEEVIETSDEKDLDFSTTILDRLVTKQAELIPQIAKKYNLSEEECDKIGNIAIQKNFQHLSKMINGLSQKWDLSKWDSFSKEKVIEYFTDFYYTYSAVEDKLLKDLEDEARKLKLKNRN